MRLEEVIKLVRDTASTNEKIAILQEHKDVPFLKELLYLTYSRRIKFYIKQLPEATPQPLSNLSFGELIHSIEKIYKREVTGNKALDIVKALITCTNEEVGDLIKGCITKDLRIGIGTRLINKVWPNLIEKTGYMGCQPYSKELISKLFESSKVILQEKMDGRFMNVIVDYDIVTPESRQGETTHLGDWVLWDIFKNLNEQFVLNGELVITGIDRYTSNGLISSIVTIEGKRAEGLDVSKLITKFNKENVLKYDECLNKLSYHVWDKITLDEYYNRFSETPLTERLMEVEKLVYDLDVPYLKLVESIDVNSSEDINIETQKIIDRGGEGSVIKSVNGLWEDKKPNYQIKIKKEFTVDLKIVGFNMGTGKNANRVSSLNATTSDGKLFTRPTGIKEDVMDYITENQEALLNTVLEVKCSGLSQDREGNYSLLHPVYKSLRDDKNVADSLEDCIRINESTKF